MGWRSKSGSLSGFVPLTILLADPEPAHWLAPANSKSVLRRVALSWQLALGYRRPAEVRNQVRPLTATVKKLSCHFCNTARNSIQMVECGTFTRKKPPAQ
jgi:hypothetical protein